LATEIIAQHEQGKNVAAELVTLNQLKDALIAALRGLMKKNG
jgi:hypothetical protein